MDMDCAIVTERLRPVNALMAWSLTRSERGRYTVGPVIDHPRTLPLTLNDSRVTVVIPTKDEEGLIGEIVDAVRPYTDEILVVDGHSHDRTRDVAAEHGARVILDAGRGKG